MAKCHEAVGEDKDEEGGIMQSILQTEKECYFTGRTDNLHKHHIYFGTANRRISEENGFWVWLTADWHTGNVAVAVHHNRENSLMLKKACQIVYERSHSRQEFMDLIGKNYLEE